MPNLVISVTDLHAGQGEPESPHKLVVWLQEEQMIIDKMLAELHNYQKLSRAVTDHWTETQRSDANAQHQVLIGRHSVATEITIRLTFFYRLLSNYHSRTYLLQCCRADHVVCSHESHLCLANVGGTVRSRGDSVAARRIPQLAHTRPCSEQLHVIVWTGLLRAHCHRTVFGLGASC